MKKIALFAISLSLMASPAFAMRPFQTIGPDGVASLTPPTCDTVNNYALSANTAQTVTWPTGSNYAIINASSSYWVASSGNTATVPSTTITTGTGSSLSPAQIARYGDSSFSIISATAQEVSVSFYK